MINAPRVRVAMLTYRRPADLPQSIAAVSRQLDDLDGDVALVVVDNDPAASARDTVAQLADPRVRYVHEPRPGIAAGRNRAIAEASDADLLVFIDDDERPGPRWLRNLIEVHATVRPFGVVGPVVSEFDGAIDPWIVDGGFFVRRQLPTGTSVDVVATNNLLLDVRQLLESGLDFDEDFGLSGGSDTLFSLRAAELGHRFVWCAEAGVTDVVPASRATRSWVLRRSFRSGNSWSRANLTVAHGLSDRTSARLRLLGPGLVRVAGGAARWLVGAATGSRRARAHGARNLARGAGMVTGAFGHVYSEYRRPTPSS